MPLTNYDNTVHHNFRYVTYLSTKRKNLTAVKDGFELVTWNALSCKSG